ncbi:Tll0287-like domain-containing protein, partial [Parathermosynechococcus lividus]
MLKPIQVSIQNLHQAALSHVLKLAVTISCSLLLLTWQPAIASAAPKIPDPSELSRAVEEIENLDAMRSGLAASLEGRTEEPTMQTMKEVCRPVGMRAMQLSQENGWQVKQIAKKYRNPDHAPDNLQAQIALAKFEREPDLVGFWDRETINGLLGTRYYRRINIEASCLACHGSKDSRPQFVKDNYPQDLAYNFHVGDLRGMYSVFIPDDVKQAIQDAVNP